MVTFTGHETRIMMNSTRTRPKKSRLELLTGWYIFYIFLLQCVLCFIAALYQTLWTRIYQSDAYYLQYPNPDQTWTTWHFFVFLTKSLGTWILLFTNMVPISLLVTLEIVKFFQAMFISWDVDIFDQEKGLETVVLSNNLNEELGQVSQIFSDKTGTLTCNVMQFKKFSAGLKSYGTSGDNTEAMRFRASVPGGVPNVNFDDAAFFEDQNDPQ